VPYQDIKKNKLFGFSFPKKVAAVVSFRPVTYMVAGRKKKQRRFKAVGVE